jgi:hypothetical protein
MEKIIEAIGRSKGERVKMNISRETIEVVIEIIKFYQTAFFEALTVQNMGCEKSPYWQKVSNAIAELEATLKKMDEPCAE